MDSHSMDFQEAYSKGNEALKEKNLEEARKYLEIATKLKPNDVYAINKLAMVCKELGDFATAKSLLDNSIGIQRSEGKQEDLYSNYLLGNTYLESGDVDKAIITLEHTVKNNPNDKYALNSLALAYRTKGDYDNCLRILRSDKFDKNDLYYKLSLATVLFENDEIDEAQKLCNEITKVQPNNTQALVLSGRIYIDTGEYPQAHKIFNQVLAIDGKNSDAHYYMGRICLETATEEEAREHFNLALAATEDKASILKNLGVIYYEKGDLVKAEEHFTLALNLDEDDGYTLSQYGKLLIDLNRPEEAVEQLKKAIKFLPDYSFAYYNLAKAYKVLRDFPNAIYNLMFSLNYEPDDVYAVNELGRMFLEVGLNDRALRTYDEILEEYDKNEKFAHLGKAEALFAMGRSEEAKQTIANLKSIARNDKLVLDKINKLLEKYK